MTNVSEKALIREMDADELEQTYQDYILAMTYYQLHKHPSSFPQLVDINKQYIQLTGNTLF